MGEASIAQLRAEHLRAVETVKTDLERDSAFTPVKPAEAGSALANCSAVWRTAVALPNKQLSVYVGLPSLFPDEPPIAYVADWTDFYLHNPHVLSGGWICTIPNSAALNSSDPVGLVRYVFCEAEHILKGTNANDFREEFSYYWNRCVTNKKQDVLIVDPIETLGQKFPAIFCEGYICVASSTTRLNRWASNWLGKSFDLKNQQLGVGVHLNAPLLPQAYPNTLADLVTLAQTHDPEAAKLIVQHVCKDQEKALALLLQREGEGLALGGVVFSGLALGQRQTPELARGYRPGMVPQDLLIKRATGLVASSTVTRSAVTRVDHHWIHSRGGDGRDLSGKSVLIIGCGSLGGYVAHLLSRAGVGRLTLTDNDVLGWENVGRHFLGASSVSRWKALALAEELTRELPHLNIVGINKDWRDALPETPDLFTAHDLIVSTVADWRCERPLNRVLRSTFGRPLLLGWLEPHAVAGHCLVVSKEGGCFECGTNEFGQFSQAVATFRGTTVSKEPGGCTHYQRYGPTALMPVASMISSVAIECLLTPPEKSYLNTWISSAEHLTSVGGTVSEAWKTKVESAGCSRTFQKPWSKSASCPVCAQK